MINSRNSGPDAAACGASPVETSIAKSAGLAHRSKQRARRSAPREPVQHSWRNLPAEHQILFATRAVLAYQLPLAVTVNLNPEYAARPFDWQYRRVRWHLEHKLGRPVDVLVVLCHTPRDGRPHWHGAVGAYDGEYEQIKRALVHAGGPWNSRMHREKQVALQTLISDDWVKYICGTRNQKPNHPLVSKMTNTLRYQAKLMHEQAMQKSKITEAVNTPSVSAKPLHHKGFHAPDLPSAALPASVSTIARSLRLLLSRRVSRLTRLHTPHHRNGISHRYWLTNPVSM